MPKITYKGNKKIINTFFSKPEILVALLFFQRPGVCMSVLLETRNVFMKHYAPTVYLPFKKVHNGC